MVKKNGFITMIIGIASGLPTLADTHASEKPNIIVVVVDDLGYADLSFMEHSPDDVNTPNIDRIAANGTFFSNAYITAPICSPARAGLLTGQYQQRWGNYWYGEGGLPDSIPTIPDVLNSAGYYNVKIGKTHLNGGEVEHPLDHGFDEFLGFIGHSHDYLRLSDKDVQAYGEINAGAAHIGPLMHNREKISYENGYTTDIFTDKAVDIIQEAYNQPFYMQIEYNAVHGPIYVGHPDYLERFGVEQFPFWDPAKMTRNEWTAKYAYLGEIDPDGRKRYLLQLAVLDDGIGKIYQALESTGKLKNTLIIFLSDNGGDYLVYANNAPFNGNKYMYAEGGIRVPMIVSWPEKYPKGVTNNMLISALDILPTVCEAAGAKISHTVDGKSLHSTITGKKAGIPHESLVFSNGRNGWVVRKGPWKLNHYVGWQTHQLFKMVDGVCVRDTGTFTYANGINLYNVESDFKEKNDVSGKYPELVKELTALYYDWEAKMSKPRNREGELKPIPAKGDKLPTYIGKLNAQVVSTNFNPDNYPLYALDGLSGTYWSSSTGNWKQPLPHEFTVRLDKPVTVKGFSYLPVQGDSNVRIRDFACFISDDGQNWKKTTVGLFDNSPDKKIIYFKENTGLKFIKLHINSTHDNQGVSAISEFDLIPVE
jgi:arylsulfatase B